MKTIYYLKFYIRGVAEPILYEVTKEESDRVEAELAYPSALAPSRFIEFETVTGRVVNVNPSYILMCWALFESQVRVPRIRVDEEEALAERERVLFWVDSLDNPLIYDDVNIEEIGRAARRMQDLEPVEN